MALAHASVHKGHDPNIMRHLCIPSHYFGHNLARVAPFYSSSYSFCSGHHRRLCIGRIGKEYRYPFCVLGADIGRTLVSII